MPQPNLACADALMSIFGMRRVEGWQPMDDAPHYDEILATDGDWIFPVQWADHRTCPGSTGAQASMGPGWVDQLGYPCDPELWKPIPEDLCGHCNRPGATKRPSSAKLPGEEVAGTLLVHQECEAREFERALAALTPEQLEKFVASTSAPVQPVVEPPKQKKRRRYVVFSRRRW